MQRLEAGEVGYIVTGIKDVSEVKVGDTFTHVRGGATDEELHGAIGRVWARRADRYSELRTAKTADLPKVEMSYIGG